jgi:hypothetical protein
MHPHQGKQHNHGVQLQSGPKRHWPQEHLDPRYLQFKRYMEKEENYGMQRLGMIDSVVDGLSSALKDVTRPDHLHSQYSKLFAQFQALKNYCSTLERYNDGCLLRESHHPRPQAWSPARSVVHALSAAPPHSQRVDLLEGPWTQRPRLLHPFTGEVAAQDLRHVTIPDVKSTQTPRAGLIPGRSSIQPEPTPTAGQSPYQRSSPYSTRTHATPTTPCTPRQLIVTSIFRQLPRESTPIFNIFEPKNSPLSHNPRDRGVVQMMRTPRGSQWLML